MVSRIEDHALIGDCETAALVDRAGSINWLCFPRFDSAACFAALLGGPENGRWLLAPADPIRATTRKYRDDTLVLETDHETDSGAVRVIDCMPMRSKEPDLVRLVIGTRGRVPMRTEFIVRFDYGTIIPWVRKEPGGLSITAGPEALHLRTVVPLRGEGLKTVGEFEIAAGQSAAFVLSWGRSHEPVPSPVDPCWAVEATAEWWRTWAARCTYQGEWRDAVVRSLITLKALTYAPTGGIVAAATTSLPERIGGERNWDYRCCWLRDATFSLTALLLSGYHDEARRWREWLLRAVAGSGEQLQIMYGLAGERRLPEMILEWLPGYDGSRPVRIGNAASTQFQLDVFGEVLDALHLARRVGLSHHVHEWRIEHALLRCLEKLWQQPDDGIWEVRGPRRHFTHSKVMAWVAFDRAVKDVENFGLEGPVQRWRQHRDTLHAEICLRGFDKQLNSFVQSYDSKELDASLLMMTLVGFLPLGDPRMRGTVEAIEKHLTNGDFVARYAHTPGVDGLPPGEGAFLLCSFWLADNYALMGRHADARRIFEKLLAIRNDVGLLSEEYDPVTGRQLGNFPQAFSHVGLINTARNLAADVKAAKVRHQSDGQK